MNNLKDILNKRKAIGLFVKVINSGYINVIAKDTGYDFIFYDLEHGTLSLDKLHDLMLMGNNMGIPSIVRACDLTKEGVSKALDFGASGVMVPNIETKEQATKLVQYAKYPPIGNRSYSGGANTNYAKSGNHKKNIEEANNSILAIAQIESKLAIQNIDDIASIEGIDALIVGPCDLSISLDLVDDEFNKIEIDAIKKVADAAKRYNKYFGIIGNLKMHELFKDDLNMVISAIDTNIIRDGLTKAMETYKKL